MTSHMTYAEAMVVGFVQGVTELFPVSSLGHNVLIPALIGGSRAQDLSVSAPELPYLAFIAFIGAYLSVRFLTRYFAKDRPLTPFGIYCLTAGLGSFIYLVAR